MYRTIAIAVIFATSGLAVADLSRQDRAFIRAAGQGGVFEVVSNGIGVRKARITEVKQHSKVMVRDHGKGNKELAALAAREGVRTPASMSAKQSAMVGRLRRLSGISFDREHARQQVLAHKEAVALFKKEAAAGRDARLKAWAAGKVPLLEMHGQMWGRALGELERGK